MVPSNKTCQGCRFSKICKYSHHMERFINGLQGLDYESTHNIVLGTLSEFVDPESIRCKFFENDATCGETQVLYQNDEVLVKRQGGSIK